MSKNLVELMAKRQPGIPLVDIEFMLSVVKEHIGLLAQVCPECEGSGNLHKPNPGQLAYYSCLKCKGSGVIARTEGDV